MGSVRRPETEEQSRADAILDAATAILVEDGYANLSFRGVARRAGMGLGNLQHYFPTRGDLIRAMLDRAFKRFGEAMARRHDEQADSNPEAKVEAAITYVLGDQKRADSCVLFWELWALASHDEAASEIMSDFYAAYVDNIADLMRELRPEVSRARAQRAGVLVTALLEGASLFRGYGRPRKGYLAGIDTRLRETIRQIIESA